MGATHRVSVHGRSYVFADLRTLMAQRVATPLG